MVQYRMIQNGCVAEGEFRNGQCGSLTIAASELAGEQAGRLSLKAVNNGTESVVLSDLRIGIRWETDGTLLGYTSGWGSEWTPFSHDLKEDVRYGTEAGRCSNGCMPWAGLCSDGSCMALALGWSGNWECCWEAGRRILWFGITGFETELKPGESLEAAAVCYGKDRDMEEACLRLRRFFREKLSNIDEVFPDQLPVVWNSWWAYEDKLVDEQTVLADIREGSKLGVTHSMLDAGWFGTEDQGDTWFEKRGDWYTVNTKRFPSGLEMLSKQIAETGVIPGIWCEIEALGKDAVLLKERPDLAAFADGEPAGYLCFANPETREWALQVFDWLICEKGYRWIKIDFNLDPKSCENTAHGHGAKDGLAAHYHAFYRFLDEVRRRHPGVVLENCASGGQRLDIEVASHMHVCFLSDKDHTEFHLQTFWGALNWLHQSSCFHFTWSQVFGEYNLGIFDPMTEETPDSSIDCMFRAAMMGVPGISLRLAKLPARCRERIGENLSLYHQISVPFVKNGDIRRLNGQPLENGKGERFPIFQLSAKDGRHILFCFRLTGAEEEAVVKPRALSSERMYAVRYQDGGTFLHMTGKELMENGLTIRNLPEFASELIWITPEK